MCIGKGYGANLARVVSRLKGRKMATFIPAGVILGEVSDNSPPSDIIDESAIRRRQAINRNEGDHEFVFQK